LSGLALNDSVRSILKEFPVAPGNDAGNRECERDGNTVGHLTTVAPAFFNEDDFIVNTDFGGLENTNSAGRLFVWTDSVLQT